MRDLLHGLLSSSFLLNVQTYMGFIYTNNSLLLRRKDDRQSPALLLSSSPSSLSRVTQHTAHTAHAPALLPSSSPSSLSRALSSSLFSIYRRRRGFCLIDCFRAYTGCIEMCIRGVYQRCERCVRCIYGVYGVYTVYIRCIAGENRCAYTVQKGV